MQENLGKALYEAVDSGKDAEVKALLAQNADTSYINPKTGQTCVHIAALSQRNWILSNLLEAGADIDMRNAAGESALLSVTKSEQEHTLTVNRLLSAGADPNLARIDSQGRKCETPFHAVCNRATINRVELFLRSGADPLQVDESNGKTPYDSIPTLLKGVQRKVHPYMELPRVDLNHAFTKEDLLREKEEDSPSPLANPLTWRQMPQINAKLREQGSHIGRAELFAFESDGHSPLTRFTEKCMLNLVLDTAQQQDERLHVRDFMTDARHETILGNPQVCAQVFSMQNALLGSLNELEQDYRDVPDRLRDKVPNYHQLRVHLRDVETQQHRQEHGR